MKKLSIAIVAMGLALSANAQVADYNIKVGDTVRIDTTATHYLTGEKMSDWVYGVDHTILQIGGKRFEEGILLGDILSWVSPEAVGAKKVETEPKEEEPAPAVEEPKEEEPAPVVEEPKEEEPAWQEEAGVAAAPQDTTNREPARTPAEHRFGIGLRLGCASLLQKYSEGASAYSPKRCLGGEAALDLHYTYLSAGLKSNPKVQLGVQTGVSIAYGHNAIKMDSLTMNISTTSGTDPVDYSNTVRNLKEVNSQLMIEVPVMFALRHECGFIMAVGPKFNIPVYGWNTLTTGTTTINANFTELGITMTDQEQTGKQTEPIQNSDKKLNTAKFNLLLGAELGYEWKLKNANGISLLAYVNAPLYSVYSNSNETSHPLLEVVPGTPAASITAYSLSNSYCSSMKYLDFGVKVAYNFCWSKK